MKPHSPIEADNQRSLGQQGFRSDLLPALIQEFEIWRFLADFEDAIDDSGPAQILGRPMHDRLGLRWYSCFAGLSKCFQPWFETHVASQIVTLLAGRTRLAQLLEQFKRAAFNPVMTELSIFSHCPNCGAGK
jgi:hypothetical protein